jgi:Valyl-tRNA synthetase
MIDKTYQPNEVEGRIYAAWEDAQAFRAGRPERAGHALQHRDPAAERDGLAAHGARAQQHFAGHPGAL